MAFPKTASMQKTPADLLGNERKIRVGQQEWHSGLLI
ncbi:hypothetical protein RB2415 [Rhodopirellula baltica SH 1]|uniref:Uncharacterized protein n=1 Tax=Rhodopirellula baltica (strain DSM 10527 / NCIMB 13988 / SH1) TaxID=243090 RepID=Q7UVV6_RHOBA|nr:hypothetical protein RB2415 [Rhodopirellula baltica SH 1]